MALTTTSTYASHALPLWSHRSSLAPSTSLNPLLPKPLLLVTLNRVLSNLEAQPCLLTPSLLAMLLAALPHPPPVAA